MKEDRDGWIEEICDIALRGHFLYLFYLVSGGYKRYFKGIFGTM